MMDNLNPATFYFGKAVGFSEIGPRKINQDVIYPPWNVSTSNQVSRFYIVCDGVGGEAAGEVAAQIVCKVFADIFVSKEKINRQDIEWAVLESQKQIREYLVSHPEANGMATTLALVFCNGDGIWQAHIGDSKIYHLRKGKVISVSKSHSIVEEMVSNGLISESEARTHPKRNVITRAISDREAGHQAEISFTQNLRHGDLFLICSDGLWEGFPDDKLASLLGNSVKDMEKCLFKLRKHWKPDARDNFSAYLVSLCRVNHSIQENGGRYVFEIIDTLLIILLILSLLFLIILFIV